MTTVELTDVGKYGIIRDLKDYLLVPEAFSNGKNIRFGKRGIERFLGHSQVFDTLSVVPEYLFNIVSANGSFWVYLSLTKAYVYDGSTHTNITRQTTGVDVNYTVTEGRSWNGTFIGGVPIFNNGADIPQWWSAISPSTKLANLTNWPSTLRAKIIRGFGPYLVALNLNDNGTLKPHTIRWSHKADPGSIPSTWDPSDPTADAGELSLTDIEGGEILEAGMLGQYLIMYKQGATHTLRFSQTNIFEPDLILETAGILAARCFASIRKGTQHFVVTEDDVIIHGGTREALSVFEDKDKEFLFRDIDTTNYANTFVFDNVKKKEAWICYPSNGNEYPNMAAVWNYKEDNVTFRDLPGWVSVDHGPVPDNPDTIWDEATGTWDSQTGQWGTSSRNDLVAVARSTTGASKVDSGYAFGAVTPTAFIERTGLSIDGVDRNKKPIVSLSSRKLCTRIWPKITGSVKVQVRMGSQQLLEGPVTWADPKEFDPLTMKYLDFTVEGLLLAWRIEWTANDSLEINGVDFELVKTAGL
jgi:hypothetical protein